MDFFSNCKTHEEVRATFKRLCKCFHPDKGGEQELMIELTRQYDSWSASKVNSFNFQVNSPFLNSVYDKRIEELTLANHNLRNELEQLRINYAFDRDRLNSEVRNHYKYQNEIQNEIRTLKEDLEDKKRELIEERDKIRNMSLGEKIKKVFGYE